MVETEVKIAAPKLMPHVSVERLSCPACGMGPNAWDRLLNSVRGGATSTHNLKFCEGAKPPTECGGIREALITGSPERFNACAGIEEPHLHTQCRSCGYTRLMRTKTAAPARTGNL